MKNTNEHNDFAKRRASIAVLAPDRCTTYWRMVNEPTVIREPAHPSVAELADWCLDPTRGNSRDDQYRIVGTRAA